MALGGFRDSDKNGAIHDSENSDRMSRLSPMRLHAPLVMMSGMRPARYDLVSATVPGYYHCISRCVRRALLCGIDRESGRSFDHRKRWIENRILELADIFAVAVYAYAVMSNDVHLVIYVDPTRADHWSAEEIAERWVRLCPVRVNGEADPHSCRAKQLLIATDPTRVALYRKRLADLPWFMRCLNEPIARSANREDACSGRFSEERYRCQALLDDTAVLACMTYAAPAESPEAHLPLRTN